MEVRSFSVWQIWVLAHVCLISAARNTEGSPVLYRRLDADAYCDLLPHLDGRSVSRGNALERFGRWISRAQLEDVWALSRYYRRIAWNRISVASANRAIPQSPFGH